MLGKARMIGIGTALAACLFGATAGFSEDAPPPRMRGTIDQVNGNAVTVKTQAGLQALSNLKTAAPGCRYQRLDVGYTAKLVCRHCRDGPTRRNYQGDRSKRFCRTTSRNGRRPLSLGRHARQYYDKRSGNSVGHQAAATR